MFINGGPTLNRRPPAGIAVVGMACRLPKARNLGEFWNLLEEGRDSLSRLQDDALASAGVPEDLRSHPDYVKAGNILEDIDLFAADFFGYSPSEAELMDPQHRIFLELAHDALEDGSYGSGRSHLQIGVFAGCSMNTYVLARLRSGEEVDALQARIANEKDYLSLRVGYKLNLRGPCLSIQTACSTSLVAVATACDSLRSGATDMALAGGVSLSVHQAAGYLYRKGGLLSPDGCCRAFSDRAAGTAPGNGAGVVLLKRVDDARRDGDHIYAVIRGAAVNNDGSAKVGFTAPGVEGQIAVIRQALAQAGVASHAVSYVECHGAGTALGDPVEISAMSQAFADDTQRTGYCAIGSVKTNIGHLDCAAGISGFIKTVLALYHGTIPASLHFQRPNPAIDFSRTPFFVNTASRPWDTAGVPRLAGVSSFGLGGTNAHVILEEASPSAPGGPARTCQLLSLSARSQASLAAVFARLGSHLGSHPGLSLADVAFTLACGRVGYPHRRAIICRDDEDALRRLAAGPGNSRPVGTEKRLVLVFRGDGVSADDTQALCEEEPVFREAFVRCAHALDAAGQRDLRMALEAGRWDWCPGIFHAAFAADYAMAALWKAWGLTIGGVGGGGTGWFAAAAVAGILSFEEAVRRVCGLTGREKPRPPVGMRMLSHVTGTWMDRDEILREDTWSHVDASDDGLDAALTRLEAKGWAVEDCRLLSGDQASRLGMLARLWESGCIVDWKSFYAGQHRRRLPLPTYPLELERARYWRHAPVVAPSSPPPGRAEDGAAIASWFHAPIWKRVPEAGRRDASGRQRAWLVLADEGETGREVVRQLRAAGQESILAERAQEFQVLEDGTCRLDFTSADDLRLLLGHVRDGRALPEECVHLGGLDADPENGLASLQALLQALWSSRDGREMRIRVVGAGMVEVTGEESIRPASAMWMAVCHTAALEHRGTRCEVIDAESVPVSPAEAQLLARRLVRVLLDGLPAPLTAIRGKYRWVREWEPLMPPVAGHTVLRDRGTYLITGGLGGVGAAIARELAASYHARVALVGRTTLPPAAEWDRYLASAASGDAVAERIQRIREIETLGGQVLALHADVAAPGEAERAVATAAGHFGALDGIIHAAGVPGGVSLLRGRIDPSRGAFPPKVEGTRALWQAARTFRPDFLALMSSVLSLTGLPGMADYCAANAFLDAFAAQHDGEDGTRVVSINWGMWRWNSWQERVSFVAPGVRERLQEIRREWGMGPEEGARAFLRALEYGLPQVAVSKHGGFSPADVPADTPHATANAPAAPRHRRPDLDIAYAPPQDALEAAVAEVWQDMLGLEKVGRDDHFLDLGGNSLLAVDLAGRLRKRFGADLHIDAIFNSPTVAALARVLASERPGPDDDARLATIDRDTVTVAPR
ncbi:MAG: SDR family NAD(P)-dependent oxidoreductase [Vicinamibacterales bacterium]